MAEWMQTLKETGFDIRAYRDAADQRAETRTQAPGAVSQEGPDVQQAVTQAIAGLSERKSAVYVHGRASQNGRHTAAGKWCD